MNMMWEWGWLANGDPADERLQQYAGLVPLRQEYVINWPGTCPSKLRFAIAWDLYEEEKADNAFNDWIILQYRYHEPYIFRVWRKLPEGLEEVVPYYPMDIDPETGEVVKLEDHTDTCGAAIYDN